ncbi:hypothetical protein MTO96_028042 [Rhipicephalus appendiculatus]
MSVRLRANEPVEQTGRAAGRRRRSIGRQGSWTSRIASRSDVQQLLPFIAECKALQRLQCAACAIPPSDVTRLATQQLPLLDEVEFSCLVGRGILEAENNRSILPAHPRGGGASNLRECHALLEEYRQLKTFTFTSQLPSPIQSEPVSPFTFTNCAAVCVNISYQRSINCWNCVRLRDLVDDSAERRSMPFHTVPVAVEDDLHAGMASFG